MVRLERLKDSNKELYFNMRNDPTVFEWCRQYEPLSWPEHCQWYDSLKDRDDVRMYEITAFGDNGAMLVVGVCGLTSIDHINSRAEFSLYIGSHGRGCSYGKAALKALLRHGFDVLNLNLIWGESFDENPAMKIFKELGMQKEGSRRNFYYRNGGYIDAHLFSITRDEFHSKFGNS